MNKEKNLQCLKYPEMSTGEEERDLCSEWSHKEELDGRETVDDRRERTWVEQEIAQPQIEEPWLMLMQKADKRKC